MHPAPEHPPIFVLSRKKPHLILIEILVILSGISIFTGGSPDEVPDWLSRTWGVMLLLTGVVALTSHLQRLDRERGMHVERGAMSMQAGAVLLYAGALTAYVTDDAALVIALLTAIAWAGTNLWEVKLISDDLKMINATRSVTLNPEVINDDA